MEVMKVKKGFKVTLFNMEVWVDLARAGNDRGSYTKKDRQRKQKNAQFVLLYPRFKNLYIYLQNMYLYTEIPMICHTFLWSK